MIRRRFDRRQGAQPGSGGRRGFSLFELTISGLLLAGVLVSVIPTLGWIVRERQAAERRYTALLAAGNLMERLTAIPFDELTAERAQVEALPETVARQLPGASLKVGVDAASGDEEARRLTIELSWLSAQDRRSAPVRLTAWVYRNRSVSP